MSFVILRDSGRRPLWGALFGILLGAAGTPAAAAPYAWGDIALGAEFSRLAVALDLRDIEGELRAAQAKGAAKPDLGRRGYGCMRRDDPFADITCVSHEEKAGDMPTREIRLHFLTGVLQQFSITAELQYRDALLNQLRARYGTPTEVPDNAGGATHAWRNADARIDFYAGKDLVFVSFEAAAYQAAVRQKRSRAGDR